MLLHSFDKHLVQAYRLTYTHCDACTVQTTHSMRFGTPATMCIKIERSYLQKKKTNSTQPMYSGSYMYNKERHVQP